VASDLTLCARLFKDPIPALSHWLGAGLSVAGTILLLDAAHGRPRHLVAFAIYGASLVLLYVASALAHSLRCSPRNAARLDAFDYAAIFLLIAGSYTPICLVSLRGPWGWTLLAVIWALALAGIGSVLSFHAGRSRLRVVLYVVMGWVSLLGAAQILRVMPGPAVVLLLAGGFIYTAGAVVFVIDRPHLWPGRFAAHDLWHCMVLAASACHYLVMLNYVAPAP
jgi:hemolysin III